MVNVRIHERSILAQIAKTPTVNGLNSSKLQLSIRFTPSRCLGVRQDWYPMYYPEGMKARVSPVQSIEPDYWHPHGI